jgi:cyclic beta-1,2-glucan synthetase
MDATLRPLTVPIWLSNGTYAALMTPGGTGFSLYRDQLLSSWQDDPCEDELGFTVYVRDLASGAIWTVCGASLPGCDPGMLCLDAEGVVLRRVHADVESSLHLGVLAQAPAERRRLRLCNQGAGVREFEVTGFVEVVLNHPDAHAAHPGFSKLFVQTHWDPLQRALVATRRPRANDERHPALAAVLDGGALLGWETDRARFLGRGRRLARARGLTGALENSVGNVLDPAFALRTRVRLAPGETLELVFLIAAAESAGELPAVLRAGRAVASLVEGRLLAEVGSLPPEAVIAKALLGARLGSGHCRPGTVGIQGLGAADAAGAAAPVDAAPFATGNGFGAFAAEGREYHLRIRRDADGALHLPPMPWSNVIANEGFGLIASEKGALSTFAGNSRLHRVTPWRNDPVVDPHDEAFYVRDERSGDFWSALPGPAPAASHYEVRHGFGYTRWQHRSGGLEHEVTVFVPRTDPLRIAEIRLRNPGGEPRSVAVYAYNRWVLGASPAETRGQVQVSRDPLRRAVLARNPSAGPFAGWIGFAAFAAPASVASPASAAFDACVERAAFLGVPGYGEAPQAVREGGALPDGVGADPCAALRLEVVIPAGGEVCLTALLGAAESAEQLDRMLAAYRRDGAVQDALAAVGAFWNDALTRTQVRTPSAAIDLMVNGWLAYQTISCRLWSRTAYYQSGGAYGFRDQLQDAAALVQTQPEYLRTQLLRNAAHQFVEGDVLHWWHPPQSQGIRTRFADDLVWLPYLAAHYLRVTGDAQILDERVAFLTGPPLLAGEDERYFMPQVAAEQATLYEHCLRALERGMTLGAHGLPLFGSGDWNDGMNRVGREGRGESVWMGFFLYTAIGDFLPQVRMRGDEAAARRLQSYRDGLIVALNDAGWDGSWYRRGYYDNGAPLGSQQSDECKIDALAQAWAVIAGVAPPERAALALDALERHLISPADGLIRLLAPPFEHTPQDPGYIKGYVAGVRENGGQYTHAALWVVRALAEAGRRDQAAEWLERLSPVTHTATAADVARYQVEPYVIAADVYGVAPHVGRGGWTWYTGSAGWMLRVAIESVLGFCVDGGAWLTLRPRIPDAWPGFRLTHRRPDGTSYEIEVDNPQGRAARIVAAELDGAALGTDAGPLRIPLAHDGRRHALRVTMGSLP